MGPRWRYLFGEVGTGLRRNLLMTVATIVTVTVSLAVLGAGAWTHFQVRKAQQVLYAQVEISMFLADDISPEQRTSIESDLVENPLVEQVIYESKEQAYENARQIFANDPELLEALRRDALPASFRVKLVDPRQFDVVASAFEGYPGIEEVVDQREILGPFFDIMDRVRDGAIAVALLQLAAAAALISNTIRLTAFARREQTGIMKLVGATNWYIRLPFMLEGITAGLIGSLIAGGLLIAADVLLLSGVKDQVDFFPFLTTAEMVRIIPILVLTGVLVASLASFLSLRRFLDV
ncbi:MAG TPA: permease-like cell division protein FtsX [Egibacteraceae bacterium]|nr:permease-like cell division protein FtsX [Egibacteraceae bacterium]